MAHQKPTSELAPPDERAVRREHGWRVALSVLAVPLSLPTAWVLAAGGGGLGSTVVTVVLLPVLVAGLAALFASLLGSRRVVLITLAAYDVAALLVCVLAGLALWVAYVWTHAAS